MRDGIEFLTHHVLVERRKVKTVVSEKDKCL